MRFAIGHYVLMYVSLEIKLIEAINDGCYDKGMTIRNNFFGLIILL